MLNSGCTSFCIRSVGGKYNRRFPFIFLFSVVKSFYVLLVNTSSPDPIDKVVGVPVYFVKVTRQRLYRLSLSCVTRRVYRPTTRFEKEVYGDSVHVGSWGSCE